MLNQPMSSPMMKTMLGRLPVGGACCACAVAVSPVPDSTDAANSELPFNSRSRRFSPAFGFPSAGFSSFLSSLITRQSSSPNVSKSDILCSYRSIEAAFGALKVLAALDNLARRVGYPHWRKATRYGLPGRRASHVFPNVGFAKSIYCIVIVTPPTAADTSAPTRAPLSCRMTPLAFCNCAPPAPPATAPPAPATT